MGCCGNNYSEWRPTEAVLFCIRAISNYVSVVEAEVMPQVYILEILFLNLSFATGLKLNFLDVHMQ